MQSKLAIFLLCGGIALKLVLLLRMYQLQLVRRYPIATVCLSFSLFRTSGILYLSLTGNVPAYGWLYFATQPILWILYFLLILELYSLVLEDFPGIRRLVRIVLFSGLAVVALVCCVVMILEEESGSIRQPLAAFLVLQDRNVFLCLSALTTLFFLFVSFYRLPICRNLWVLSACFGGYFILSSALSASFRYFGDTFTFARNLANSVSYLGALSCASLLLSRAGESEVHRLPLPWRRGNQELEFALLGELRDFNQVLGRLWRQWQPF